MFLCIFIMSCYIRYKLSSRLILDVKFNVATLNFLRDIIISLQN